MEGFAPTHCVSVMADGENLQAELCCKNYVQQRMRYQLCAVCIPCAIPVCACRILACSARSPCLLHLKSISSATCIRRSAVRLRLTHT